MGLDLSQVVRSTETVLKQHAPAIFTGLGITAMISSAVLTGVATPKALKAVEEKKIEEDVDILTPIETVKTVWKFYIPPVTAAAAGIGMLMFANNEQTRRSAALATAYAISESKLVEYSEKVKETIGEKKEKEVREAILDDQIKRTPVVESEIVNTGKGDFLCMDAFSGRMFRSSHDALTIVQYELNKRLDDRDYISLNEFYELVGLSGTDGGDRLGWRVGCNGLKRDGLEIMHRHYGPAENGEPCCLIHYNIEPEYGYEFYC